MKLKAIMGKPKMLIGLVFVAVGLLGFGAVYALSSDSSPKMAAPTQATCPVGDSCVSLLGKTASPDIITIKTGSYIRFNSADGGKHNIALEHAAVQHEDDHELESGDFEKDEAWRVQFKQDGTYTFRDKYNPDLKVSVIVYTEGKTYKIE